MIIGWYSLNLVQIWEYKNILHFQIEMFSSIKKNGVPANFQSSSGVKSKSYQKSIMKSSKSINSNASSCDVLDKKRQIRKLMTSNAYNNVFSRLVNIQDLGKFISQSVQYVQFHQEQVQKFILPGHNNSHRFSFSLRTSIYSFLSKDHRFLRHYFQLLAKQFPQKKQKLRRQIYEQFKQHVLEGKKFDNYFSHNSNSRKDLKSLHNPSKNQFNIDPVKHNPNKNNKNDSFAKSVQKNKLIKNMSQSKQVVKNNNSKQKNQESIKQIKIKYNCTKRTNKLVENGVQSKIDTMLMGKNMSKKSRSTKHNIQIIEQTLNQIENMRVGSQFNNRKQQPINQRNLTADSLSLEVPLKYTQERHEALYKTEVGGEQSQRVKLSSNQKDSLTPQIPAKQGEPDEDQIFQQLMARRKKLGRGKKRKQQSQQQERRRLLGIVNIEQKTKSTRKRQRKTAKFSEYFDFNDPQNKLIIQAVSKMKQLSQKQQSGCRNQSLPNQRARRSVLVRKPPASQAFDQRQRGLLNKQQQQLVALFPQISTVGDIKLFTIDQDFRQNIGSCNGLHLQKVLAWPTDDQSQNDVYLSICLRRNGEQKTPSSNAVNQFKGKLALDSTQGITLLLVQK